MKKNAKTIAIATTFAIAMAATSCTPPGDQKPGRLTGGDAVFDPYYNEEPCVYGPAPDYDPDINNEVQTEYGVPLIEEYDPNDDEPEVVYGPPIDDLESEG